MRTVSFLAAIALCLPVAAAAQTKESILPAGTLLRCTVAADSELSVEHGPTKLTLIALKEGTTYGVTDYWIEGDRLSYKFGNGAEGSFDFGDVDWRKTIQLNAERGTVITQRGLSH